MMAGLLAAGFTAPFPITALKEEELVIKAWIERYPGEDLPGSKLMEHYKPTKRSYIKELTFVSTLDHVWVESFIINAVYSGWILKEDDGACMLVERNTANSRGWRGYHAWCGAEFGFTSRTIANTGPAPDRKAASEIEAIPKEVDLGKGSSLELDQFISQGTVGRRYNTESIAGTDHGVEETARQVSIKKEPSRTAIRQVTMRRNQLARQGSEERWRFETPPLSSLDRVKKRRWPPQYVSPPPTRQRRNLRQGCKLILNAPGTHAAQSSQHRRSSSPELLSVSPRASARGSRRTGDAKDGVLDEPKAPPPKRSRKNTADTPHLPISPVSPFSPPSINTAMPEPTPKTHIILHFFLQRRELGALPTPLAQCETADQFFDHAEEAWDFLISRDEASEMAAVSVQVEGVEWPMILPWRDPLAHQWMMETIAKAALGRSHDLHVQVKCITK